MWTERAGVDIIKHNEGSDPASVVFDALAAAKARQADVVICDTAGRLHNKKNLMDELKKISRIVHQQAEGCALEVLLALDATTGQNAVNQARQFNEVADITGIILTKLDGTAKGGIIISITDDLQVPVKLVTVGEKIDDIQPFSARDFVEAKGEGLDLVIDQGEFFMDKVLFVVDMQEMYVGRGRDKTTYSYDAESLIDAINKRISAYKAEEVFYIVSYKKGLLGGGMPKEGTPAASFPAKLKVVSKNIYSKSKPDAFSNVALEDFMRARNVKEIEFVGVDGGISVINTAIGAIECGMKVVFNEECIGTVFKDKANKCREKLKKNKVTYIHS